VPAIPRDEARGGEIGQPAVTLLSILKLVVVGIDTIIFGPLAVVVGLFSPRASYRVCQLWVWLNLLVCGVRVHTRRLEALDPSSPYVFMSNHRSQYDILAVVAALPEFQLRWVAKKELTRVPVFGWALKHTGHIVIDRSDTQEAVRTLRAAHERMLGGISVTIFPEGTRSPVGEMLLPLKKGGFMLALETGIPIVPMVVRGSGEILPRGTWYPVPGDVEVIVGAPIPVVGMDRDELIRCVRAFMLEHLAGDAGAEPAAVAAGVK
jgi:1-acyl-sn-glycerol-3-phosphate acyltransferase